MKQYTIGQHRRKLKRLDILLKRYAPLDFNNDKQMQLLTEYKEVMERLNELHRQHFNNIIKDGCNNT